MTAQPQISDHDLMVLCGYKEALGEIDDGIAAVYEVIRHRMALKFESDGTVSGTVLRHAQFSWVEYDMVHGVYTRVAATPDAVQGRVHTLLSAASRDTKSWDRCEFILTRVLASTYAGSAQYRAVRDQAAVLYANLADLDHHPVWAMPDKFITKVQHHSFYRA